MNICTLGEREQFCRETTRTSISGTKSDAVVRLVAFYQCWPGFQSHLPHSAKYIPELPVFNSVGLERIDVSNAFLIAPHCLSSVSL